MATTTRSRLADILPESETYWRSVAAAYHRRRARTGDEAAARTHELHIHEIREALLPGSSRQIRFCPRCLARGVKYILIHMGSMDRCGTCRWPDGR